MIFPIIGGHLWIFLLHPPCFARDVRRDIIPAPFCRRMGLPCHPMAGGAIERSAGLATTFAVHIPCCIDGCCYTVYVHMRIFKYLHVSIHMFRAHIS